MRTIFDTSYGRGTGLYKTTVASLPQIIASYPNIVLNSNDIAMLTKLPSIVRTPMYDLYTRTCRDEAIKHYTFFNTASLSNVPIVLAVDELSIYGKAVADAPDHLKTMWVNVAHFVGKRRTSVDALVVQDIPRIVALIVRGLLCMSYAERDVWMSPANAPFLVEMYSMAATMRLRRAFSLDMTEEPLIKTAFAFHYAKMLDKEMSTDAFPSTLLRCSHLGAKPDIDSQLSMLTDATPNGDLYENGLATVCEALSKVGPAKMRNKFSAGVFYRLFPIGSMENMAGAVAIDYPPYWAYLLLSAASGSKIILLAELLKSQTYKRKLQEWVDRFIRCRELLNW